MSFDSFPILFFVLLRFLAGVPAHISDTELRVFGCVVGLLLIGMIWLNARWLRLDVPLVSLVVIGFNPMMIRYGDSIRAYGLGMIVMLLSLGAIWRLTESCTRGRVAFALTSALLSVHTLYYNAVLLFAICMGAVAVSLCARKYKQSIIILAIGAIAAVSLLPYRSVIKKTEATSFIWKVDFTIVELWRNLAQTLGSHSGFALVLCVAVFLLGIGAGLWGLTRKLAPENRSRLLFAVVTLLTGAIGYSIFLLVLSYRTRPWYYVVIIAFVGICLEMIFAALAQKKSVLLARAAFALLFIGAIAPPTFGTLFFRQTNIDRLAHGLEQHVAPGDLIVLNTWNYGISFQRYYHGPARFATVPPIEDLRCHRVDLVKERMVSSEPIAPVLREIEATLRAGKTVWLVGWLELLRPGQTPLTLAPGVQTSAGWNGGDFYQAWSEQLGYLLQTHSKEILRVPLRMEQPVMFYELLLLHKISGWRDDSLTARS
jgi:hypothetical protein